MTNVRDLWATRSYVVEQMGGKAPDLVICNSGLTEAGYRFGRALPEVEEETVSERRARALGVLEQSRRIPYRHEHQDRWLCWHDTLVGRRSGLSWPRDTVPVRVWLRFSFFAWFAKQAPKQNLS